MYAVIFRATIKQLDDQYVEMASKLRQTAMEQYGCIEFTSCAEGRHEMAISYWKSLEQIQAWKQNTDHLHAQAMGREKWYNSYRVEVVEVQLEYANC